VSHCNSQVPEARALYSASEEDLEMVGCFLAFQQIREFPIKKQYPVIDFLVSMHPPQSASVKPTKLSDEHLGNKRPVPGQPLRYLRTL
jgi:hypothetical protein